MRTWRTRVAACATAFAFALTGCGGTGSTRDAGAVALQAADDGPGVDGEHDTSRGGNGWDGGDATSTPGVDEAREACLSRNDDVVPWREQDVSKSTGWHRQKRQKAHVRIIKQVYERLGGEEKLSHEANLKAGFLGYDLDPIGSRLIMTIDPARIDHADFARWVEGVARQANKATKVQGSRLTVTVQDGCFPAAEYEKLRSTLLTDRRFSVVYGDVALNGAIHAKFCGEDDLAYAKALRERVGPMFSYTAACIHSV